MTKTTITVAALLATAGTAIAQDSVSATGGSDALSSFPANGQMGADYVVDLVPFNTSWGTEFGIGVIAKTSAADPAFNNNLGSSQAISINPLLNQNPLAPDYAVWNTPGAGVGPNQQASSTVAPGGLTTLFAGLNEFGGEYNGTVGAGIQFDPNNPGRLFVSRKQTIANITNPGDLSNGGNGGLAISENGMFITRSDCFGCLGTDPVSGNNIFAVDFAARNTTLGNVLGGSLAGFEAATSLYAVNNPNTITVPNVIPGTDVFGSATFGDEYIYGDAGGVTVDAPDAHLGAVLEQHRGSIGTTDAFTLDTTGGVATFGMIGRQPGANAVENYRGINLWSVDATGARVSDPTTFIVPETVTDFTSGYVYDNAVLPSGSATFRSQTAFQGGVGQVAVGADQAGNGLATINFSADGSQDNPDQHIIGARFDPANPEASVEFGLIAWTFFDLDAGTSVGSEITDGNGGVVGQLATLDLVTGGVPFGPSFSVPAIDSVGNVWFQSSVELFNRIDTDMDGIGDASDFDSALIRAVYDTDAVGGPAWELELVVELGQFFVGNNSGVPFIVTFLGTADSNSLSSGTFFSNNAAQSAYNGFDVSGVDTADSRTNGGVVINAEITYDADNDGDFNTDQIDDPGTIDQDYNALLYIGNLNAENPADPCLVIDYNGDGFLDNGDIGVFVQLFIGQDPSTDLNGDGIVDNGDIGTFVQLFLSCVG